jgi:hypothetical protein
MYSEKNEGVAVYGLNSYTWKLLRENLGWKSDDYMSGVPIIPSAQQPELMETGKPFIVYGGAVRPPGHLYVHREESVAYNVYGTSSTQVNKVVSLLAETFVRQDESAADVNEWLDKEAVGRGYSRNVSFTTIRAVLSERAEPSDEEGGYVSGYVLLEYKYVAGDTGIVTSGFTYP